MKIIDAKDVHAALGYPGLVDALAEGFASDFGMPARQVFLLDEQSNGRDAFALLPSWNGELIAVKAFTYFPENAEPYKSLYSKVLVFDRAHGEPLAMVDGTSVTFWRTAGISALATRLLARADARSLLVVGTGNLAPYIVRATASVRELERVRVWGRRASKAEDVARRAGEALPGVDCAAASDLQVACGEADIIVCATGSGEPLVMGEWVKPGTHTDFMGNHHADHRECDTALVSRARVYVDTYVNCFKEAGEILVPISEGAITKGHVRGELSEMCRATGPLRPSDDEITLFKSVGNAYADLIAAGMAYRAVARSA